MHPAPLFARHHGPRDAAEPGHEQQPVAHLDAVCDPERAEHRARRTDAVIRHEQRRAPRHPEPAVVRMDHPGKLDRPFAAADREDAAGENALRIAARASGGQREGRELAADDRELIAAQHPPDVLVLPRILGAQRTHRHVDHDATHPPRLHERSEIAHVGRPRRSGGHAQRQPERVGAAAPGAKRGRALDPHLAPDPEHHGPALSHRARLDRGGDPRCGRENAHAPHQGREGRPMPAAPDARSRPHRGPPHPHGRTPRPLHEILGSLHPSSSATKPPAVRFTTSTLHGAWLTRCADTLPSSNFVKPVRPCEPTTSRSTDSSRTACSSALAGSPITTFVSQGIPATVSACEAFATSSSCSRTSIASISAEAAAASNGAATMLAAAFATLTTIVRLPAGQRMRATNSTTGSEHSEPSTAIMIFILSPPSEAQKASGREGLDRYGTDEAAGLPPSGYSFR